MRALSVEEIGAVSGGSYFGGGGGPYGPVVLSGRQEVTVTAPRLTDENRAAFEAWQHFEQEGEFWHEANEFGQGIPGRKAVDRADLMQNLFGAFSGAIQGFNDQLGNAFENMYYGSTPSSDPPPAATPVS